MFRREKAFHTLDDGSNGSMVMYSCQAVHSRNDDLGAEGMKKMQTKPKTEVKK
jgi:hypothetical protein